MSDIDVSIGTAHEAGAAESARGEAARALADRRGVSGPCPNCGAPDNGGAYCHVCGQSRIDLKRPIWSLIKDIVEAVFAFDGRFWRTVPSLLIHPGRMTRAYLDGKRASQMQPFRLFLFTSLIFFIVFTAITGDGSSLREDGADAVVAPGEAGVGGEASDPAPDPGGAAESDAAETTPSEDVAAPDDGGSSDAVAGADDAESSEIARCAVRLIIAPDAAADPACQALDERGELDIDGSWDGPYFLSQTERLRISENMGYAVERPEAYVAAVKRWAPRIAFVLFPVYALLLALTHFWKRKVFLFDHVITSIHFHTFLFIFMLALAVVWPVIGAGWASFLFLVWTNIYLYKTLRLVYHDGRIGAFLRVMLLDFVYLIILIIAMTAMMAAAIITI